MTPRRNGGRRVEDPDELLTASEAAEILHLSTESVYRMLRAGTLPPRYVGPSGRSVRVRRGDVRRYLDTDGEAST